MLVYWEEGGVDFNFIIFIYVVLKFNIDNWCWKGVLFYLWIGKWMLKKVLEIVI